MANCPNCGRKLKLTDWRPNCPDCGVNIAYFGIDERLQAEADVAEVEHVKVQRKLDRCKAAFVGSPFAIIRIFLSILPIGALMLPLCSIAYNGPFIEDKVTNVNIITLYNTISSLDFDALFTMIGSKLLGSGFVGYLVSAVTVLLSAVMVIVSLFALTAANGPKGNIRNIFNNSLAIVLAIVSMVFFNIFSTKINSVFPEFFSGKFGAGAFVYLATLVILLIMNIIIAKKNIPVKYKECFIGGIPSDRYEQMIADGVSMTEIHAEMDRILAEREAVRQAEAEKKEAENKAKEEEELARKAGKL